MERPEESKILPTHSVALTIPFKPPRAGIVFSKGFHDSRVLNSTVQNSCVGSIFDSSGLCIGNFILHMRIFLGCGRLRFKRRNRKGDNSLSPYRKSAYFIEASSFSTEFFSLNSAPSFLPVQLNGRFYKRKSSNSLFAQCR